MSNNYTMARVNIKDEETGDLTPVDTLTSAKAVACDNGKTAQDHFSELAEHIADVSLHEQEMIAVNATLQSGDVVLELPYEARTGILVKFTAPCACTSVTGGLVIGGNTYQVVDAMGNVVTGKGGVWETGSIIAVLLDCTNAMAYMIGVPTKVLSPDMYGTIAPEDAVADPVEGQIYVQLV